MYQCQVETISYIESMMLGDPFDFLKNVPNFLSRLDSCSFCSLLYRLDCVRSVFTRVGSGILLFYDYLDDNKVRLEPNKRTRGCGRQMVLSTLACSCLGVG